MEPGTVDLQSDALPTELSKQVAETLYKSLCIAMTLRKNASYKSTWAQHYLKDKKNIPSTDFCSFK